MQRRSISQVLFSYLPDQTADLENGVWRVVRWSDPKYVGIDADVVRRELSRVVYPWTAKGEDNGLRDLLLGGMDVEVITPSERGGVEVERFPQVYRCRHCGRIRDSNERPCPCGHQSWAQMPFVAYHKCGKLAEPWIRKCQQHNDVSVRLPGSATTRDLRFTCPVCNQLIQEGFSWIKCECGDGTLDYNVHRAAVVYTPRSTVIVNPPNPDVAARLRAEAAAEMTLTWVADGMQERGPLEGKPTLDSLIANFVAQGFDEVTARAMAEAAAEKAGGAISKNGRARIDLEPEAKAEAVDAALKLAYATSGGRTRIDDMISRAGPPLRARYENLYKPAIRDARLLDVELLENFPVLTAVFGFTRGEAAAGASTLRWFRSESGALQIHGHRADTEALLFRLDPLAVGHWMAARGYLPTAPSDAWDARIQILRTCEIPHPGEVVNPPTPGTALLTLIHSMSHRVMRKISAFSGIERDALSEYLVPLHLSFVVYASTRGDFVLGGLQALFEHDLEKALGEVVHGEPRCALDPGCSRHGGACVACLHVGEPSCRYYNQFLTRDAIFGTDGYLLAT